MQATKFKSWESEQQHFVNFFKIRHTDSKGFVGSVFNSVRKQSFFKSRPKVISKSLAGEVLGRISVSESVRKNLAYFDANQALLTVDKTLKLHDLNLSWDDESLCAWAKEKAKKVESMIYGKSLVVDASKSRTLIYGRERKEAPEKLKFSYELQKDGCSMIELKAFVEQYGFRFPHDDLEDLFKNEATIARLCDECWWRRKARVAKARAVDQLARSFRMVHARAQVYACNEAVKLRRAQAKRNRMTLEGFEAINQDDQSYTLAELSDLSVSNPANRRHELMVRIKGFEQLADQFGHEGLFITMSAPSRFHPMRQVKDVRGRLVRVEENKNYGAFDNAKYSPREAQEWLCKTWALIRAEMARQGVRCYGFRVVEPHHDGCPHWHQLLFFKKYDLAAAERIFKRYMMRTDTFERGAGNRLKIITIDKSKGSACGYIAKYICKSIDGSHIADDLLGNGAVDAAERICAWASVWGIRQFQQIGGASVTVWRELRRLENAEGVVEEARDAADASDWAAYCLVQGDDMPFFGRDEQAIRPAYWFEHDAATGEVLDEEKNKYGENSVGKLFGIVLVEGSKYFMSRFYRWTIQRVGECVKTIKKALPVSSLSSDELLDLLRGDGSGSNNREAIALDLCQ